MRTQTRTAIMALTAAGVLWGLTVPLSKVSLVWLGPAWLTVARFVPAGAVLALVGRRRLRAAMTSAVAAAGAVGFGAVVVLQNDGIQRTSVSHAAVLIGAVPVLVALIAAGLGQAAARRLNWGGYALALAGVALIAGAGGAGSGSEGDLLVLASAVLSAAFIVVQPRLLAGRDAAAVTAVQFGAGALVALPVAVLTQGAPHAPAGATPVIAFVALALAGTLLPFWLFAFGQARVPARLAGAFMNLEPVVGAVVGWLAFGDPATAPQLVGVAVLLAGIALSTLPARARGQPERRTPRPSASRLRTRRGRDPVSVWAPSATRAPLHGR